MSTEYNLNYIQPRVFYLLTAFKIYHQILLKTQYYIYASPSVYAGKSNIKSTINLKCLFLPNQQFKKCNQKKKKKKGPSLQYISLVVIPFIQQSFSMEKLHIQCQQLKFVNTKPAHQNYEKLSWKTRPKSNPPPLQQYCIYIYTSMYNICNNVHNICTLIKVYTHQTCTTVYRSIFSNLSQPSRLVSSVSVTLSSLKFRNLRR
eukprot:TRINITY_DN32610_c0_g1_i1.p1 TRINITY_DN32610_c0_g1~~TRINITY_DN32610_c0_g1_i1.p1  ORF type:complete len:203 (-),score=-24.58 TRINITY_DN32610_c0_g1_i1:192-800(-)